jgi:hypothetical protein
MSGIDETNLSRPKLIKPYTQNKLLHLEFETNPINNNSDYIIKVLSQSLQINYHSVFLFIFLLTL